MDSEQHNHNQPYLPAGRTGDKSFDTMLVNRIFHVYITCVYAMCILHVYMYTCVYISVFIQFSLTFHIHFRTGSAVQRRALAFTHSLVIARLTKPVAQNCSVEPRTVEQATQLVSDKYKYWRNKYLGSNRVQESDKYSSPKYFGSNLKSKIKLFCGAQNCGAGDTTGE